MNAHPDRVTLEDLADSDFAVRQLELRLIDLETATRLARQDLANARQHQHHLVARYREQAARPLVEP